MGDTFAVPDGKQILDEWISVSALHTDFGNPRKIGKRKREELRQSLETFGNFGIILIDESNNIIAGNQRVSVIRDEDPDAIVHCKRLVGYTEAELRAINIKDNVHAGDWDLDLLADWTADITVDLGLDSLAQDPAERKVQNMEPIRYEKYDYVMLVCRNELDYDELVNRLGIAGATVKVAKRRTIHARAIWYDQCRDKLFGN